MPSKNTIIKALIENQIVELMIKSNIENIFMSDGTTTLAAKLAEIISSINTINADIKNIPTDSTIDAKISAAIDNLINGAPDTYDTLKEIADYLSTHQSEYTALVTLVGSKVDKVDGKGLSTNDFTTAEKNKLAGIAANANNYTLPAATSSALGGVKIGSNITNSSGTISVTKTNVTNALGYTPPQQDTTYSTASTSEAGLMSAADKSKLDGIAAGANNYTHPTTAGNKHIPSGGSTGQILKYSASGTAVWANETDTTYSTFVKSGADAAAGLVPAPSTTAGTTKYLREDGTWTTPPNTTYSNMTAATASAAGEAGLVPAPAAGKQTSFLRGDGTWVVPTNTTYSAATTSASGLMSAEDKTKLDGIATGANKYTLPAATSSALGGVKIGNNITNTSGTISLSKTNVTAALGYDPERIYVQSTQPTTLKPGDLWIQLV